MAFDIITPAKIGQAAITVLVTTVYTVPADTRAFLKDFMIANTTAGALNARIFLVPNAGTAGTTNAILYDKAIAANDVYHFEGVQILNEGDTIQVQGSGAGLTITASGAEAT